MIKLKNKLRALLSFGTMLLLTGCSQMEVFNPKGPIAADEKRLLIDAVLLMLIVVVPTIILTFLVAYKYRASNTKAKYSPNWAHSTILEAGWWSIPIVIIIVLATMTWRSTHQLDPYKPLVSKVPPVTIQVVALEWKWLFIYPQQHFATVNFVEFPVNTPVNFVITSDAPMNSFQIQQLAGQIYAMAGMQTKLHLLANETGDYYGRSVSFSGDGFSGMTFDAKVVTQDQFNQWVKTSQQSPNKLTMSAYNQLAQPSENNPVQYFSAPADGLFNNIMMKYMMPMPSASASTGTKNIDYKSDRSYEHHKDLINPKTNNLIKG
ncbi:MAG: cyoA [Gammaproteobacteria bacterium]|nr:cyoA [Gammaproteobacteria bacterium]